MRVVIGYQGPWHAEVKVSTPEPLPTAPYAITIAIGDRTRLVGTLVAQSDGTQALTRSARIVAGAGGWTNNLAAQGYHNDVGVKARLVVEDLIRATGERLGTFIPRAERIGVDYARRAGTASRALTDVIGGDGIPWWVDLDGVTQVGSRPAVTPPPTAYEVLSYDPAERVAVLDAADPSTVPIAATLTQGLDAPGVVRELEWQIGGEGALRIVAWLGGEGSQPGRLAGLLTTIAQRATDRREHGLFRYRVVSQGTDGRMNLQAVRAAAGLPDLAPITVWPGVPGVWATVKLGAECLVGFIEGDRAQPVVLAWAPYGAGGFAPQLLTIGGPTGEPAARKGDAVEVTLPNGSAGGSPITWDPVTPGTQKATGKITAGSSVVKIAPPHPPVEDPPP
jgi:hypothetical protein